MKLCKKVLAIALIFAMVMSCSMGVVMAEGTWTNLINDSFVGGLTWSQMHDLGWATNKTDKLEAANDGTKAYMSITEGEVTRELENPVSTGKYEISYTIKTGSTNYLALLYASDNNYLIMSQGKNGTINTKTWSTNQFGTLTDAQKNSWITVKHIFDMLTGKYNVNVYDEQGNILLSNTSEYEIGLTDLKQFKLQNTASSELQLKDFAIKQYTEEEEEEVTTVSFNETFDTYDSWTDANANGWSRNKDTTTISGETGAKYVRLTEGQIDKTFTVDSGVYEISYSLKPGSAKPLVLLYNSTNNFHILSQCSTAGAINTASWSQNGVANINVNNWITVKHIVDLDNNTATCKVYDAEGYLIGGSTTPYNLMNGISDIAKLTIQNQNGGELLVDNVVVKPYAGETTDKTRLAYDTFDNITSYSEMTGWTGTSSTASVITAYGADDATDGNYVVFTGSNFKRTVSPSATSGKYKISYKFKPDSSKPIIYLSGNNTGNVLLTEVVDGKLVTNSWSAADMIEICTLSDTSKWINIEAIVDVTDTSIEIKAYDENGALIGEHERDHLQNVDKNKELTNFTTFNVDNWTNGTTLAFDNLIIESYIEKPELTQGGVTILDYKAEAQSLAAVSPAVKSITLDFGTVITEASKELISITPAAQYTGAVVGDKYVMTFDKALNANTTYTIKALAGVANATETLGSDVSIDFITGAAVNDVCLASVTDASGNAITDPAEFSNKTVTINTYAANCSEDAKPLVYIVALYNGYRLTGVYLEDDNLTVPAGAVTANPVEVEIGEHSNITRVKVFLWNSMDSMVPYSESIEITNN